MERKDGCVVEFIGLPAVGKTKVATGVLTDLRDRLPVADSPVTGVTTSSGRRDRLHLGTVVAMVSSQLFHGPTRSIRGFRGLSASQQPSYLKLLRYGAYQLFVCEELRRVRANNELHLADQGFFQHLWRVHLTAETNDLCYLDTILEAYGPVVIPDIMVVVTIDHETRMQRGVERGTSVAEELFDPGHPEIQKDEIAFRDIVDFSRRFVADSDTDVRFIEIENTRGNLAENTASITDLVLETVTSTNQVHNTTPPVGW